MSYDKDQKDSALPLRGNNSKRSSADFLPKFFRTPANKKILQSTIDQFISEGTVDKVNGYIGRKVTKAKSINDIYVSDVSNDRVNYQLEPAIVINNDLGNVTFFKEYNDYINLISFFNGSNLNHNRLNSQEYYSWDPQINWDKFINYREYYWLPNGPLPIAIAGQQENVISTYKITLSDEVDNVAYVFSPDGLKKNPSLRLYRGQTYRFEIDCPGRPILFKFKRTAGSGDRYTTGVTYTDENGNEVTSVEKGIIEFEISSDSPNVLYYVSENDVNSSGLLKIYDIVESTSINVETELIGKKTYSIPSNNFSFLDDRLNGFGEGTVDAKETINLSNGMKVFFQGNVTPEKYANGFWYVEGVGDSIYLISENELATPSDYTNNKEIEFDNESFDTQGFDVNKNYPLDKDYILINRGSKDRNPWSRYNRWFHREVIENSARLNNQSVSIDQSARAVRPIIEFNSGLELFNFGKQAKDSVTLVDTFTTDVFSTIEGSLGYNIDGIDLAEGMRVLFVADNDPLVYGRIFKVKYITHLNVRRLALIDENDTNPIEGETVLILEGNKNAGKMYYYESGVWLEAQNKTSINQSPLFDVFDDAGISFSNKTKYVGSTFAGTKLFSYASGNSVDAELNFKIQYRNIGNIGDIVFNFDYYKDKFLYQDISSVVKKEISYGYLKINNGLLGSQFINGWTTAATTSYQPVVKQYELVEESKFFEIDMFDNVSEINDSNIEVYLNNRKQTVTDFTIFRQNNRVYVEFYNLLPKESIVVIKVYTDLEKNENGFYEFPFNMENNPLNSKVEQFTLGEILDHVQSMVNKISGVTGSFPGNSNIRDLGNISKYGNKVIQSSSTLVPAIYHIAEKSHNVINSLRYSRDEYAKFKRNFIRTITDFGFDGEYRVHLDLILDEMTKDKAKTMPFYLTDMVPFKSNFIFEQEIIDDSIKSYPLIFDFNLDQLSEKAVLVYLNEVQLLHGKDYIFENDNFITILSNIVAGDNLKIVQYESTDGCFVPPTPTKLGMYPLFEPQIFVDTTYQTPTKVIQGHDGSIVVAFDDYRDDLILELEKRIFNNIKIKYDPTVFNLFDYIEGYYRASRLKKVDLDNTLRQDFLKWSRNIVGDYIKQDYYDVNNSFTYNYKNSTAPDELTPLLGFWRGTYKYFYDTDRPHTHPWEMLGYKIKPNWWETVYGPAPYTSNNLILWKDLSEGLYRIPNTSVFYNKNFARPTLLSHIPVDEHGNLLSPLESGLPRQFSKILTKDSVKFGDEAPIETAWRRSSEYPFALITSIVLNYPADAFSKIFDRSRQVRDQARQLVYKTDNGNVRFNTKDIVLPSIVTDSSRVFTSGLVNFITDYCVSLSIDEIERYKKDLERIEVRIASKLGGFTNKDKFRLILDSRSPLSQGSVFVPQENYQIELNKSSPLSVEIYSGVIVEKSSSGYIIRGYSKTTSEFKYFKPRDIASDPVINIGGISEDFIQWTPQKFYSKGVIVRYSNEFYRTSVSHESTDIFETKYFSPLPKLPITGGREAILRRSFDDNESILHYGSQLSTVQEVVDFLLGYGKYLESRGFIFDFYNNRLGTVLNWSTSAKEFMFWTTQNWSAGSLITLSPAANQIKFKKEFSIVDSTFDNFFEYSILKADGEILDPDFTNSYRESNEFTLVPRNTADGIFYVELMPVQKEHVLILDNLTVFNDVIYDQAQGYRQERIRVLGYKTTGWNGDFNIPGFVYDQARISLWEPWKDYFLGETVKYKEFYYSAKFNVPGTNIFNFNDWYKLEKKPTSKLIPNWDYKANQFADFYDLDTDSFDAEQQKFAQHLIGYQKRQYLENIINNDVSQYKFYQGMIQEKGTQNVLSKLFDVLSASNKESLEFYEEWAIRLGQYGGTDTFKEVEYRLSEDKFLLNPQPIELSQVRQEEVKDFVYRIYPQEVLLKDQFYDHKPFPLVEFSNEFIKTPGYVVLEDVNYTLINKSELTTLDSSVLKNGDYIWVGFDEAVKTVERNSSDLNVGDNIAILALGNTDWNTVAGTQGYSYSVGSLISVKNQGSGTGKAKVIESRYWDVYRFTILDLDITEINFDSENSIQIEFKNFVEDLFSVNDFLSISNSKNSIVDGFRKIINVSFKTITVELPSNITETDLGSIDVKSIVLHTFISNRLKTIDDISFLKIPRKKSNELVWVDKFADKWAVWKYSDKTLRRNTKLGLENFSKNIFVSNDNRTLLSSTKYLREFFESNSPSNPADDQFVSEFMDSVILYDRVSKEFEWNIINVLLSPEPTDVSFDWSPAPEIIGFNNRTEFKELDLESERIIFYRNVSNSFGDSVAISKDKEILVIGAPLSSSNKQTNIGYVAIYNKVGENYSFNRTISLENTTTSVEDNAKFGNSIFIENDLLYVVAPGIGKIFSFNLDSFALVDDVFLGNNIIDCYINDKFICASTADKHIHFITLDFNNSFDLPTSSLGIDLNVTSIALSNNLVALGVPTYSDNEINQGAVFVGTINNEITDFNIRQKIVSNLPKESELFGSLVKFNISGDQLVISAFGGSQTYETIFNDNTTFDLDSTTFSDTDSDSNAVYTFDIYKDKFVYGDTIEISQKFTDNLETTTVEHLGTKFGTSIVVTDVVYLNDPQSNLGNIFEYDASKSWSPFRIQTPIVDTSKIKTVFLYSTVNNSIIEKLDYVDPIRGKILGIADQEISFKTYYDPAVYSIGTVDNIIVDDASAWVDRYVGKLWWDIKTTKFLNASQGNSVFKANTWNEIFPNSTVEIYEWVESIYSPEQWDELADTEEGLTQGISGKSKYGNSAYSLKRKYDTVSQTFSNVYYFWVKDKVTIPNLLERRVSAKDVADYIEDPKSKGIKYITFLDSNSFALVNCAPILSSNDIAINIRYWTSDNKDINVHSHYQILAENDPTSIPNKYVEQKWIDSLIGSDILGRDVPDNRLADKVKYGILSTPRQSMFVNRLEALKQFVERVNTVLKANVIIDDFDISDLLSKDNPPLIETREFDAEVESRSELRFVTVRSLKQASLSPVIVDGKIIKVNILEKGFGYGKTVITGTNLNGIPTKWAGPTVKINGAGTGAVVKTEVNINGEIVSAVLDKLGEGYTQSTTLTVRPFTVLVKADETANGKWSIYTWNYSSQQWFRSRTQKFDTTKYWEYFDWYANGFNLFTKPDYVVNFAYELNQLNLKVGDIVKVKNQGSSGWLLIEKIDDSIFNDITINFRTVGRQNGTIQLKDNLYKFIDNNVGFDGPTFDNDLFDTQPKDELRTIFNVIKNNLFIDNLAVEYNKLFFASLRYALSEQLFVDWAFKTSFVKSKHNVGSLTQKINYQNDNLSSYEDYINEVKPYRTKVREFVSSYEKLENTNTTVTDFDLPARYNLSTGLIEPFKTKVVDSVIEYDSQDILNQPYSDWLSNSGYEIVEVKLIDAGSGYKVAPQIIVSGISNRSAKLRAYISKGKITNIVVEDPGEGYLTLPEIIFDGSFDKEIGTPARAIPILGNGLVRGTKVGIKFDRIASQYTKEQFVNFDVKVEQNNFIGTGSQTLYPLKWPLDIKTDRVFVTVDNEEKLISEYTVYNVLDSSSTYKRYRGYLQFNLPPEVGSAITIQYYKDIDLLNAADRILYFYETSPGKVGKDLSQLMQGVDYGGVELTGIDFDIGAGWDALPWFSSGWDGLDPNYDDFLVRSDGTTRSFELNFTPSIGELVTVYWTGERNGFKFNRRIDDPYFDLYDGSTVQENGRVLPPANTYMTTFVGDGQTNTVTIPEEVDLADNDLIIFRKTTSDGSFIPDEFIYDTELSGGNFAYTNAKGIAPEEILVDGDGFVTPISSHAPEEIVTGQVLDTLDLTIYHKRRDGPPILLTKFYKADGSSNSFDIGQRIFLDKAVLVKKSGLVLTQGIDYIVNFANNTVELTDTPNLLEEIAIFSMSISGNDILDANTFIADGETLEFITNARWSGDVTVFVSINGEEVLFEKFITDETYELQGSVGIAFLSPPKQNDIISYIVLGSNINSISRVDKQSIVLDGSTLVYELSNAPFNVKPLDNNVIVDVGGHILRPRDTIYFDVIGSNRTFVVDVSDYPFSSIEAVDVEVFVNGIELSIGLDYVWNTSTNELVMRVGRVSNGDKLALTILTNREYRIVNGNLELTNPGNSGEILTVTTFSNHDILNIERNNDRFVSESALTPGSVSYYKFNKKTAGKIELRNEALSSNYVWVSLNNELLTPNVDYVLEENKKTIRLSRKIKLTKTDVVDVICFDSSVSIGPYAYKMFKDILNRTSYIRVDQLSNTELLEPLKSSDRIIKVVDASVLETPNPLKNIPGVIFIDGERIEYFTKNENELGQLRRGTLGTGVRGEYPIGTIVNDASVKQIVPYKDEFETHVLVADGSTQIISLENLSESQLNNLVDQNSLSNFWYRDTIPESFGQTNILEVFVSGKRLHKLPRTIFNPEIGPYSSTDSYISGDQQIEAEFSARVTSDDFGRRTAEIRLTEIPDPGAKITIQLRIGKLWTIQGETLGESDSLQAKFIRATSTDLPK